MSAPPPASFKLIGGPLGTEDFGFIFTKGSDLVDAGQRRDRGDEGRRHARRARTRSGSSTTRWGSRARLGCAAASAGSTPIATSLWLRRRRLAWRSALSRQRSCSTRSTRQDLSRSTCPRGIGVTVFVTVVAFALASALGLGLASAACPARPAAPDRPLLCRDHPRHADAGAAVLHRLRRRAGAGRRLERADAPLQGARRVARRRLADLARDHRADARLLRLHRRGFSRRHPGGRHRPDRGGEGARPEPPGSASASSCCRRRCARSCRRSATTSSP